MENINVMLAFLGVIAWIGLVFVPCVIFTLVVVGLDSAARARPKRRRR